MVFEFRFTRAGRRHRGFGGRPTLLQCGFVRNVAGQHRGGSGNVIGKQTSPSVTHVGLDYGCAPRHLGLTTQWFELPTKLGQQIAQPYQIVFRRIEFADGLFLALAMLEDAGGLFNEATALLGSGTQNAVELPLPDDDVHFTADPRIAEEFLYVQETARMAIDRILRSAIAEHRA